MEGNFHTLEYLHGILRLIDQRRLPGEEVYVECRTEEEVADAIRSTNLDVSGGQLKGDRTSVAVRTLGEELRGIDLENIVVRSESDGRKIFLSDLAVIRDAFIESDLFWYSREKLSQDCRHFRRRPRRWWPTPRLTTTSP